MSAVQGRSFDAIQSDLEIYENEGLGVVYADAFEWLQANPDVDRGDIRPLHSKFRTDSGTQRCGRW